MHDMLPSHCDRLVSIAVDICWQGLAKCLKLEELSLDNNIIRHIEGASHWTQLQRLSLADNLIASVENSGLATLAQLQHLSLENNYITSVAAFQKILSLSELYISNNLVDNARDIFHLKVTMFWLYKS